MDTQIVCTAASAIVIGLAWVVTGAVAVGFPPGRRLEAILALVVGGGVGIAGLGLALALEAGSDRGASYWAVAQLVASVAGAVAVFLTLAALSNRAQREP